MKQELLNNAFNDFCKIKNLKHDNPSHFEGEKYVTAKVGTLTLNSADARCGNLFAIVLNKKGGTITTLTSYLSPKELLAYMEGATTDLKKQIKLYK